MIKFNANSTNGTSTNTNYTSHYQNPPLPPRFLALSQQQQQQQSSLNSQNANTNANSNNNNNNNNTSCLRIPSSFGINLTNQQQKSTPTSSTTAASTSTTTATTATSSSNLLSQSSNPSSSLQGSTNVNITSGNSIQSFIAARGFSNALNNNNNNQNSNSNSMNILNQLQQQQQSSSVTNSATTALIANLAAAANSQSFAQSLPQCTLNNTLFVGNLHASLQEIDLIQVFRPFGRIVECCKKWLHFGFVKFSTEEEACRAYVTLNGFRLKGRPMRLEFQNRTKKARIKAILAQAALQAASKPTNDVVEDVFASANASAQSPLNMLLKSRNQMPFQKTNPTSNSTTIFNPNATKFMPQSQMAKKEEISDLTFFDTEKLLKFATTSFESSHSAMDDLKLPSYVEMAWNSVDLNNKENQQQTFFDNSKKLNPTSFDSSQWMTDISIGININNIISQANSPSHDDNASSASSSLMSCSSDSGFRSTLFTSEEDLNKQHQQQQHVLYNSKPKQTNLIEQPSRCETPLDCGASSISEHLEFTYSHSTTTATELKRAHIQNWNEKVSSDSAIVSSSSGGCSNFIDSKSNSKSNSDAAVSDDDDDSKSYISSSDTSHDASLINDDFPDEVTPTIAPVETAEAAAPTTTTTSKENLKEDFNSINYYSMHSTHTATKYTQQLMKDIETFMKKNVDIGIYSCMNKTNSFFVEPEDVLKPLNQDDYNEYQLFPMMEARFVDSYPEFF